MKLYAVCVKAKLEIDGRMYQARMTPVSKVAHLPVGRRGEFNYIPAVFTNRAKAEKWLDKVQGMNRNNLQYEIIDFDSGLIELEV